MKQIVFYWKNDGTSGENPPAAIDNIEIVGLNCGRPVQLTKSAVTANEVTLSWTETGNATQWLIYYKSENDTEYSSILTDENPHILTDLEPATTYEVYVKAVCENEESGESDHITTLM